jgi:hypothetical protein
MRILSRWQDQDRDKEAEVKNIRRVIVAGVLTAVVLANSTMAFAAGYKFSVTLKPTSLKNSQGTPITVGSGTASITLYPARRQVCYAITVHDIKLPAKGAYIKTYKVGSVGSTVVTLGPPGTSGTSSGCVRRGLRRSTINDIRSSPNHYYVIVTTTTPRLARCGAA